jgi:hypothetical protein
MSLRAKWKTLLAEYGQVALGVYFAIFGVVFACAALAIQLGFSFEGVAGSAGTLGGAWIATKLTQPIRILATVALTPVVGTLLRRFGKKKEISAGLVGADVDPPPDRT